MVTGKEDSLAASLALNAYTSTTPVIYEKGVLAVRGSHSLSDFWLNSQFFLRTPDDIHLGFYIAAGFAATRAKKLLKGTQPQIITGHSLGGAVALILGYWWGVREVITFGCPKVGGAKFVVECELKGINHRRYVLGGDVVPSLPPKFGYFHYGSKVVLPDSQHWWGDGVEDHDMYGYLGALKRKPPLV